MIVKIHLAVTAVTKKQKNPRNQTKNYFRLMMTKRKKTIPHKINPILT